MSYGDDINIAKLYLLEAISYRLANKPIEAADRMLTAMFWTHLAAIRHCNRTKDKPENEILKEAHSAFGMTWQ